MSEPEAPAPPAAEPEAPPAEEAPPRSRLGSWFERTATAVFKLSAAVGGLSVLAAVVATLVVAGGYVSRNRGALRIMPFIVPAPLVSQGVGDTALALQLGRMLNEVVLASRGDLDVDPGFHVVSDTGPPQITVPGAGVSVSSLVGFLQIGPFAETQVRGTIAKRDDGWQVVLQVVGPEVGTRTLATRPSPDVDAAVLEAAEALYGVLRPPALAAYLFRRDPTRCREVIRTILANDGTPASPDEQAAAYRIWGVLLRDDGDYPGSRAKLETAIGIRRRRLDARPPDRATAAAYVDLAHTAVWEGRTGPALAALRKAVWFDPTWAAPYQYRGDVLLAAGTPRERAAALAAYRRAIALEPLRGEAWSGLGAALVASGEYADAIPVLAEASRLEETSAGMVATQTALAEALLALGRQDEARAAYERVMRLTPGLVPDGEARVLGIDACPAPA